MIANPLFAEPIAYSIPETNQKIESAYLNSKKLPLSSYPSVLETQNYVKITPDSENPESDHNPSTETSMESNTGKISSFSEDILIFKFECIGERLFLQKLNTERLYCVKHTTAEKLIERGWGEFPSLTFSTLTEKSDKQHIKKIFSECYKDVGCVIDNLKDFSKDNDEVRVIHMLSEMISVYEENIVYCHPYAHHLGHFLTNYLGEISTVMPYLDSRCGGGLYHGVFESYFEQLTVESIEDDMVLGFCQDFPDNEFSRDRWECLHALGHGLMKFYANDAISAVDHCGNLENQWAVNSCSKGVFMENLTQHSEFSGEPFDANNIFYPCDSIDPKFAPACYTYQAWHVLVKNNHSKSDSFATCDGISPEENIPYCYGGIGKDLAYETFDDIQKSLEICSMGQSKYKSVCLTGMVRVVIDHIGLEKGFEYCKVFPDEFKSDCYDLLGKWVHMVYDSEDSRKTQCLVSENTEFFEICMGVSLDDGKLI